MIEPLWTAAEVAAACDGTGHGDFAADSVTFDSREVIGGELFVALKGEATDGHRFVEQAMARGAAGLLVSQAVDAPHVRVADTTAALTALAVAARDRAPATRIGVTGSVGKTGVKEALRLALARHAPDAVHASVKSYNNHTGVPLSLARMPREARFGVFEMGMNHAGELAALTDLVRPHIAVVTWVASAHREYFATEEAIADAKAEIFAGLPATGTAIIPTDNPHAARLRAAATARGLRVIGFGAGADADVRAERFTLDADGTDLVARVGGETLHCRIGMAGRHWVGNALAVLAAVDAAGGDLAQAGLALADLTDLPGRGRRLTVPAGAGTALVIDESYNANPASMAAAIAVLGAVTPGPGGKRIALLGEMKELGALSDRFHAELAPHLTAAGVTAAVLVGNGMTPLADALGRQLGDAGSVRQVGDAAAAGAVIAAMLASGDVLLVKGSNSVGLGGVVARLAGVGR